MIFNHRKFSVLCFFYNQMICEKENLIRCLYASRGNSHCISTVNQNKTSISLINANVPSKLRHTYERMETMFMENERICQYKKWASTSGMLDAANFSISQVIKFRFIYFGFLFCTFFFRFLHSCARSSMLNILIWMCMSIQFGEFP